MRAIEQGRYLARAANTGISGVGRSVRTHRPRSRAIFEQDGARRGGPVPDEPDDLFADRRRDRVCVAIALIAAALVVLRRADRICAI